MASVLTLDLIRNSIIFFAVGLGVFLIVLRLLIR